MISMRISRLNYLLSVFTMSPNFTQNMCCFQKYILIFFSTFTDDYYCTHGNASSINRPMQEMSIRHCYKVKNLVSRIIYIDIQFYFLNLDILLVLLIETNGNMSNKIFKF